MTENDYIPTISVEDDIRLQQCEDLYYDEHLEDYDDKLFKTRFKSYLKPLQAL